MAEKRAVSVKISGRVQGVNFRMETSRAADRFGVGGWVRNEPDGTVAAYFEGDADNVDAMLDWCRQGPPAASVTDVKIKEEDYTGRYREFNVRF